MIEIFDRSKHRPVPCGLVSTLKSLEIGESIVVSEAKKSSIHPAAKRAGVRMTLRTLGDGTVCAWRVPTVKSEVVPTEPRPVAKAAPVQSIFNDGLDIFGQPFKKAAAAPVPTPASSPVAEPAAEPGPAAAKPPTPRPKGSGYYQADRWSCKVWYEDLDKAPTATVDTIFS